MDMLSSYFASFSDFVLFSGLIPFYIKDKDRSPESQQEKSIELGDNCIQNFNLGRYIVGYSVGNFVLRRRVSGAVKHNCRTYIRRYTAPNENFEYGYPHSNVTRYLPQNVSCVSDVKPLL